MNWPEEHIAAAIKLFTDGLTATQIAIKLNKQGGTYTRNAVIGKLTRLGYSRGRPATPSSSRAGVKIGPTGGAAGLAKARARNAAVPLPGAKPQYNGGLVAVNMARKVERTTHSLERNGAPPAIQLVASSTPRLWTTRRFGECAAPVAGDGAETHSCCAPVDGESAWCAEHRARFCVSTKKPLNVRALSRVA